jgi:type II restriction/modification system DNA methylase subunit YeeA
MTPNIAPAEYAENPWAIAIAEAAKGLNSLREAEVVPGYPDRIAPMSEVAFQALKKRTLTKLYNERPTWLQQAHKALDEAVAAAYGWPVDLSDDEILARLFALNQDRASGNA